MIKVLIVEDIELLRNNYCKLINGFPGIECIAALPNALNVVQNIQNIMPDIVLMDINMPKKNGIAAVREIRENGLMVPIVMHTIFEDDEKVFDSILAGANGYILKSTSENQLLLVIQEAVLGGAPMTPSIATKVLRFFRDNKAEPDSKDETPPESQLSERQQAVLELLMDGASYKMIADELCVTMDTVRYHIKNIYRILHINSKGELIRNPPKNYPKM